jgi:hypothetical protein
MPTFLELAYNGNYVGRGLITRSFVFTYNTKVFLAFPDDEKVFELHSADGVFSR